MSTELERVREKLYERASITLTNLFERLVREDQDKISREDERAGEGAMTDELKRCQTKAVIRGKEVRCAEIDGHATAHVFYPGEPGEPAAEPELCTACGSTKHETGSAACNLAAPAPAAPLEHIHRYDLEGREGEYWYQCEYCGSTLPWPDAKDIVERNASLSAELEQVCKQQAAELEQVKAERDLANRHAADLFKRLQAAEAALGEKGK